MIVSPNKGVFFVATMLMCSAALYAQEISSPAQDPLRRVFVGEPNQLSVPPGYPAAAEVSLEVDECALSGDRLEVADLQNGSPSSRPACAAETPSRVPVNLPGALTDVSTGGEKRAPASLSTAVQAH